MRILVDGEYFFAGQGALSAMNLPYMATPAYPYVLCIPYMTERARQSYGKMTPSFGVDSKMSPSCIVHRIFGITKKFLGLFLNIAPERMRRMDTPSRTYPMFLAPKWHLLHGNLLHLRVSAGYTNSVNRRSI